MIVWFLKDGAVGHCLILLIYLYTQIPEDIKGGSTLRKQSKAELGDYSHVSILSVTFTLLERIVYNQLTHYLKEKKCYTNCN